MFSKWHQIQRRCSVNQCGMVDNQKEGPVHPGYSEQRLRGKREEMRFMKFPGVGQGLVGPGKKLRVGKPQEGFKLWRYIQKMTHAL